MKKHIVCLGDSNTHGYCADVNDCADGKLQRFNEDERWTKLLQQKLGDEYLVIEEGLSGRTTVFDDPLTEGLAAFSYITPCLKSHEPVSLLVIMLGTNDTKERFGSNATCISLGMERLVKKAQSTDCWGINGKPNILVVCPPPIDIRMESSPVGGCMGAGCAVKSQELAPLYQDVARRNGCYFFDAKDCEFNQIDFMHLTSNGHKQLAQGLFETISEII